jgi:ribonuclease G
LGAIYKGIKEMDEIIIQKDEDNLQIIVLESGEIVEFYSYELSKSSIVGNIYMGIVKNVFPSNNTLFVDIGLDKNAYLQLDKMEKTYKAGDKVLVQVKKDETSTKGAKITSEISIAGRFIVLLADSDIFTYSQKINRDEKMLENVKKLVPEGCGAIIRSEAKNVYFSIIELDLKNIISIYEGLKASQNAKKGEIPQLLYDKNQIEKKVLVEFCKSTTKKIYINDKSLYESFLKEQEAQLAIYNSKINMPQIEYKEGNIINEFGLETQFDKLFQNKYWLKSGGNIVIEKTEALTSIDVNTAKNTGKGLDVSEELALKTNIEAAKEILKQIRAKNIGGIVVIDFINLKDEAEKEQVIKVLEEEKQKDRSKIEILGFTKLGLVELSRKKM